MSGDGRSRNRPHDTAESLFIDIVFILKSAPCGELKMRIGDQEIGEELQEEMNAIVSVFVGAESRVTEIAPPQFCRSSQGNQYRLTVDNNRHISVKHAYSGRQDIGWEVFHSDMRQLLELPHYKLERKTDFPCRGGKTKNVSLWIGGLWAEGRILQNGTYGQK